jgi:bifunctional non-homologous end joining protein LigD
LSETVRSIFTDLLFRRSASRFFAFDLLWLDAEDFRRLTLLDRKARLKKLLGRRRSALLYVDHIERNGVAMFDHACRMDLEGIVAKPKAAIYRVDEKSPVWIKIKNPAYSQNVGRDELIER